MKKILALLMLMAASAAFAAEKHFIAHSWDLLKVNTDDLVRNLAELEKLPLDGISISLSVKSDDGKRRNYTRNVLSDGVWTKESYAEEIQNIRKISSGKLKHNFVLTNFAPEKRLDWTDDAAWEKAAGNAAVLAWIVKEGGARGIMVDPEDYPKTNQFYLQPGDPSYAETAALARKRGAQIMKAMASENPDIVILCFGFLRGTFKKFADMKAEAEKKGFSYGNLWIQFYNGILDELPPGARIVDATEAGYVCSAAYSDFYHLAFSINRMARELIAPENHEKFLRQCQVGFGLYIDMYITPESHEWSHPATDGSRMKTLFKDFSQAMTCADEYCWIYGERYGWIKWDCQEKVLRGSPPHMKIRPETWEEMLPGLTKNLRFIAEGETAYRDAYENLVKTGKLVNRIANPECSPGKKANAEGGAQDWTSENLPPGWVFWRKNPNEGSFGLDTTTGMGDSFSVKASGVDEGCFIHSIDVKPGEIYACEAFKKGGENSRMKIRWMHDKKWLITYKYDVTIPFCGEPDEQGWQRAFGFVQVPPEANRLHLLIGTGLKPEETVRFDNPGIYLITPENLP